LQYIIHEGANKKGGTGLLGVGLGPHSYSVLVLIALARDRGSRWGGLPTFMFMGIVLAVVSELFTPPLIPAGIPVESSRNPGILQE